MDRALRIQSEFLTVNNNLVFPTLVLWSLKNFQLSQADTRKFILMLIILKTYIVFWGQRAILKIPLLYHLNIHHLLIPSWKLTVTGLGKQRRMMCTLAYKSHKYKPYSIRNKPYIIKKDQNYFIKFRCLNMKFYKEINLLIYKH